MRLRLSLFLILSLFLSACASSESPKVSQSSENISRERAICKNEILKDKSNVTEVQFRHCETLVSGETDHSMSKWYANTFKVSLNVSKYNNGVMGRETEPLMKHVTKDTKHHAGFFYAHQPSFSINILVKNHPDISKIAEFYKGKSWAHFVKIKQVKYTEKDLEAIRHETDKIFYGLKTPFRSSTYTQKTQVWYDIEGKEKFLSLLKKKNIKLHEIVRVKEGSPYVCTLIGCRNKITVNLPEKLKPDNYLFRIKFDGEEADTFKVLITNKLTKECKKYKRPPPINALKSPKWSRGIRVGSEVCKDKNTYIAKSVAPFKSFTVDHDPNPIDKTDDPVKMEIEIFNGKGASILKQNKTVKFDPKSKKQPNGKRCEPICYVGSVGL